MNIYIHVEVAARELDSKLLLAVVAASRGHDVLVSDLSSILRGVNSGILKAGIFHTKSLTPKTQKINRHQKLCDRGYKITSIDEEGGLVDHGYDFFAEARYSERTVGQASAVFGWGAEDADTLKRVYPGMSSRIHQTGSPRADLWRPHFSSYWGTPCYMPEKPYLLVPSNLGSAIGMLPFHELVKLKKRAGYFLRHPETFLKSFGVVSENYRMLSCFVEAIHHLASNGQQYDIVLRPHPSENIEAWKIFLEGTPNVHIIREGSVSEWINNGFAVMHNGCTTALEASISGKPIITYMPFTREYSREIPNELGDRVESLEALAEAVDRHFRSSQSCVAADQEPNLSESVVKKIYLDDKELAAEKIVNIWESLDKEGECGHLNNWWKYHWHLTLAGLRKKLVFSLRKAFPRIFGAAQEEYKFPPMSIADIRGRISRLQRVLGLNGPLEVRLISERSVLVRNKRLRQQ